MKFDEFFNRFYRKNTDITSNEHESRESFEDLLRKFELSKKHLIQAQELDRFGEWTYLIKEDRFSCSDQVLNIHGFDNEQITLKEVVEKIHKDDRAHVVNLLEQAIKDGSSFIVDFRSIHAKTNRVIYLKVKAEVILEKGKPHKLIGVTKDYTIQKELEVELMQLTDQYNQIFHSLDVGIWMKKPNSDKFIHLSKGIADIFELPLSEVYKHTFDLMDFVHLEDINNIQKKQQLLYEGQTIKYKFRLIDTKGNIKWVYSQTLPWVNEDGEIDAIFGVLVDITDEVNLEEHIQYLAEYDKLTGLPNRHSLDNYLDSLCEHNSHFAVIYLDIDRLNIINNSLGYQIGDGILKVVAQRLKQINDTYNCFSARLTSNDFIVIYEDYETNEEVFSLATELMDLIGEPINVEDYQLHVTTSIGICFYPEDGNDRLSLIERAHSALFRAKQKGKNNYQIYSRVKDISSYKKYELEKDMWEAIENSEFELYFQPQVEPNRGIIQGAEALIRWNHKVWGQVSPVEFIPLAEENHLINDITDWEIKEVVALIKSWKDKGYTMRPISINISPIRLMKNGLAQLVKSLLEKYEVAAKYLMFEITEGSLLYNDSNIISTINELKEIGIKIAIDDFGTGYSSLGYIRQFEVDAIKIDKIFVQNINQDNNRDAAIISSVLTLANELGISVVAEGVEDVQQLLFLKQKECELIQGYLYSKPVNVDNFEKMLEVGYLKPTEESQSIPFEDRREYYRLEFSNALVSEMSIVEVNDKKVNLGSTKVFIENLSLGGIKIISDLKLPVSTSLKFVFKFTLLNQDFEIYGRLVWMQEGKFDTYLYGVKFDINETAQDQLAEILNKVSIMLKLGHEVPGSEFIKKEPAIYLANINRQN